jgi:hypothetical protein
MEQKHKLFLVAAFILTTIGCSVFSKSATEPTSAQIVPTNENQAPQVTPTESLPITTTEPLEGDYACDGHKWSIVPMEVYRYPYTNLVDLLIVDIAIHNGSDYWARVQLDPPFSIGTYLITEAGPLENSFLNANVSVDVPLEPVSPYSGTEYRRFSHEIPIDVPPGMVVQSVLDLSEGNTYRFTYGFSIPRDQKPIQVRIWSVNIACNTPNGFMSEETTFIFPLENVGELTLPTPVDYPDLSKQPIDVENSGTLIYKGYTTAPDDTLSLEFSFTNSVSSPSRPTAYLIGDDGLLRMLDNSCVADPGQVVDCKMSTKVSPNVSNLKLILGQYANSGIYVYDFIR